MLAEVLRSTDSNAWWTEQTGSAGFKGQVLDPNFPHIWSNTWVMDHIHIHRPEKGLGHYTYNLANLFTNRGMKA